jgi:hypothetical protein
MARLKNLVGRLRYLFNPHLQMLRLSFKASSMTGHLFKNNRQNGLKTKISGNRTIKDD